MIIIAVFLPDCTLWFYINPSPVIFWPWLSPFHMMPSVNPPYQWPSLISERPMSPVSLAVGKYQLRLPPVAHTPLKCDRGFHFAFVNTRWNSMQTQWEKKEGAQSEQGLMQRAVRGCLRLSARARSILKDLAVELAEYWFSNPPPASQESVCLEMSLYTSIL